MVILQFLIFLCQKTKKKLRELVIRAFVLTWNEEFSATV